LAHRVFVELTVKQRLHFSGVAKLRQARFAAVESMSGVIVFQTLYALSKSRCATKTPLTAPIEVPATALILTPSSRSASKRRSGKRLLSLPRSIPKHIHFPCLA
jgi:hypothetical protein